MGGNLDIPIRSVPCFCQVGKAFFFFCLIFSTVLFDTYLIKLNVQTYQNYYFFSKICPSFPLPQCDLWVWKKVQKTMYHWERGFMVYRGEFSHSVMSDFLWSSLAVACQGPLSMEFSRQGYWSGLSFPTSGDLPNPGIEPRSPTLQADALPSELLGKPFMVSL